MDYAALSGGLITFSACQTESCIEIDIEDDLVDEPTETFDIILGPTDNLDPRITLGPTSATCSIEDNDSE